MLTKIIDLIKLDKPRLLQGPVKYREKRKYCHYHNDVGHNTNDCFTFKKFLDKLAESLCVEVQSHFADE